MENQKNRIIIIFGVISAIITFFLILLIPKKKGELDEFKDNSNEINNLRNELENKINAAINDNNSLKRENLSLKKRLKDEQITGSRKSDKKPDDSRKSKEGTGTTAEESNDESDEDD